MFLIETRTTPEAPAMNEPSQDSTKIGLILGDGAHAKARRAQQAAWKSGQGKTVEQLLVEFPEVAKDTTALLDLVYRELLHRDYKGESPTLAEYRKRFPALAERLATLFPS
jgi:hypothetical protein